MTITSKHI